MDSHCISTLSVVLSGELGCPEEYFSPRDARQTHTASTLHKEDFKWRCSSTLLLPLHRTLQHSHVCQCLLGLSCSCYHFYYLLNYSWHCRASSGVSGTFAVRTRRRCSLSPLEGAALAHRATSTHASWCRALERRRLSQLTS